MIDIKKVQAKLVDKLTPAYIESLITEKTFAKMDEVIICKLNAGEAAVVGVSYCFDMNNPNIDGGKESAYRDAISKLFDLEAYHQKQLRTLLTELETNSDAASKYNDKCLDSAEITLTQTNSDIVK